VSYKHLVAISKKLIPLFLLVSLSACATARPPLTGIVPGRQMETLQSSVAITLTSGEHSTSGHGYLVFKSPDRFHIAVLSPFGPTVLEVYSDSLRLACVVPSKQTVYSGLLSDLPEGSGLKSIALMKWVLAPPPQVVTSATRQMTSPAGDQYYFDKNGLLERKVSVQGDEVSYDDYRNVNGVAFPDSVVVSSSFGTTVKISFDEPQINLPVEESALTPTLEGLNILPLAEFKGF
jgi:hypothetical protein